VRALTQRRARSEWPKTLTQTHIGLINYETASCRTMARDSLHYVFGLCSCVTAETTTSVTRKQAFSEDLLAEALVKHVWEDDAVSGGRANAAGDKSLFGALHPGPMIM